MVDGERLSRILARVATDVAAIRADARAADPSVDDAALHEYAEVDDHVVRADVAMLPDLEEFVSALAGWAARQS